MKTECHNSGAGDKDWVPHSTGEGARGSEGKGRVKITINAEAFKGGAPNLQGTQLGAAKEQL